MFKNNTDILSFPSDIHFEILSYFSPKELFIISHTCSYTKSFINKTPFLNYVSEKYGLPFKKNINKILKYHKKSSKDLFQYGIEKNNLRMVNYRMENVLLNNSHFEAVIYYGRINILRFFINGFVYENNINNRNNTYYTHNIKIDVDKHILEISSEQNNQDITKFLYLSFPKFINKNVINNLCYSDQSELIKYFLNKEEVKNDKKLWSEALWYACKGGKLNMINILLKHKMLINKHCFTIAASNGYINTIEILLKHIKKYPKTYVDYYETDIISQSPSIFKNIIPQEALYYACKKGLIFMVEYLLTNYLEFTNTAFIFAIEGNNIDMVKFLMETCNVIYNTEAVIKALEVNSSEILKHLFKWNFPIDKYCIEYANLVGNNKIIKIINKHI